MRDSALRAQCCPPQKAAAAAVAADCGHRTASKSLSIFQRDSHRAEERHEGPLEQSVAAGGDACVRREGRATGRGGERKKRKRKGDGMRGQGRAVARARATIIEHKIVFKYDKTSKCFQRQVHAHDTRNGKLRRAREIVLAADSAHRP